MLQLQGRNSGDAELRRTGIPVLGTVPWGTHCCHFYETKEDLLESLTGFFKAGLEDGEFCLWIVSPPISINNAIAALRNAVPDFEERLTRHDIEIIPYEQWYLTDGVFDLSRLKERLREKLNEMSQTGHTGARATGNTGWLHEKDWRDFREYEKELNSLIADQRIVVLCTYPLTTTPAAQIMDVASVHNLVTARRHGHWEVVETPELKEANARIQKASEQLERRIRDRTHALAATNALLTAENIKRATVEKALRDSQKQLRALAARLESLREEERLRISREIHDELGQKLTALKMDLLSAERKLDHLQRSPGRNQALDRVVSATGLVDEIVTSVQEIASDLRPGVLDKLGLGMALQSEARRFEQRTRIQCEVHLPNADPPLSTEISVALFRIFQECLTNVARHAGAEKIVADLKMDGDCVELRVRDNGLGIPTVRMDDPESLGLLGMKERAALLGGEVLFQTGREGGTVVTARIPLEWTVAQ
ncbi:MAG TPA: MEDS domain-containing protein [Verrucomicrobiae bacterium]|nr:MEDS domain-containing protein [Verrucomicrobiae bacterium]